MEETTSISKRNGKAAAPTTDAKAKTPTTKAATSSKTATSKASKSTASSQGAADNAKTTTAKAKAKSSSGTSKSSLQDNISNEQRYTMIETAAYFIAESRGFCSNPVDDWLTAENLIDTQINQHARM